MMATYPAYQYADGSAIPPLAVKIALDILRAPHIKNYSASFRSRHIRALFNPLVAKQYAIALVAYYGYPGNNGFCPVNISTAEHQQKHSWQDFGQRLLFHCEYLMVKFDRALVAEGRDPIAELAAGRPEFAYLIEEQNHDDERAFENQKEIALAFNKFARREDGEEDQPREFPDPDDPDAPVLPKATRGTRWTEPRDPASETVPFPQGEVQWRNEAGTCWIKQTRVEHPPEQRWAIIYTSRHGGPIHFGRTNLSSLENAIDEAKKLCDRMNLGD